MAKEDLNVVNENIDSENNGEELNGTNEQTNTKNNIIDGDDTSREADLGGLLRRKEEELKEYIDIAQRVKAEFENYKRRTAKEREQLYTDITADVIAKFLPILDNLERAASVEYNDKDGSAYIEGINMVLKQFKDVLAKEGVEEIPGKDEQFDPNYHEAVMHLEDENYGPNTVVEVFQKGYKLKDKVLRYSMVKVVN